MERMMADFEVDAMAVNENDRSDAGAEGKDQINALSGHAAESLHVRIVGDSDRPLETLSKRSFQIVAFPSFSQVRGGVNDPVLYDTRKPDGDAVEPRAHSGELFDHRDDLAWSGLGRGGNSPAVVQGFAFGGKGGGLYSGAADIDGQCTNFPRLSRCRLCYGFGWIRHWSPRRRVFASQKQAGYVIAHIRVLLHISAFWRAEPRMGETRLWGPGC